MGQALKRIAAVVVTALLVTGIAVTGVIAYQKYMNSDQASALKYYEKKDAKEKKTEKDCRCFLFHMCMLNWLLFRCDIIRTLMRLLVLICILLILNNVLLCLFFCLFCFFLFI